MSEPTTNIYEAEARRAAAEIIAESNIGVDDYDELHRIVSLAYARGARVAAQKARSIFDASFACLVDESAGVRGDGE